MNFTEDLKLSKVSTAIQKLTNGTAKAGMPITLPLAEADRIVSEIGKGAYEKIHKMSRALANVIAFGKESIGSIRLLCVYLNGLSLSLYNFECTIGDDGSLSIIGHTVQDLPIGSDLTSAYTIKAGYRTKKDIEF